MPRRGRCSRAPVLRRFAVSSRVRSIFPSSVHLSFFTSCFCWVSSCFSTVRATELVRLSVPFPPVRRAAVNRADGTALSGSVRFGAIVFRPPRVVGAVLFFSAFLYFFFFLPRTSQVSIRIADLRHPHSQIQMLNVVLPRRTFAPAIRLHTLSEKKITK